jgi:hypothetical protein
MIDTITQLELDRFNEESNSLPQTIEIGSPEWIEICEFAKCL